MVDAKFTQDGRIRCINPGTGEVIQTLPQTRPETVPQLLKMARMAQGFWGQTDIDDRIEALQTVRDRLWDRAWEIAESLHKETGKPVLEAFTSEVVPSLDLFDHHLRTIKKHLRSEKVAMARMNYPGKKGRIEYVPLGILGLISPWNYPFAIPLRTLVPALLAGNAILFKPSEYAALTGRLIGELFDDVLPRGLFTVLQGGADVGRALCETELDRIVFTGSVATGRTIAAAAAERLIPVSLELGGKDAAIVLADCDLERTVQGVVWGAFTNAGQNCASIERVFVEEAIADEFEEKVAELTKELRHGPDVAADELDVGPVVNRAQFEKVRTQLEEALQLGARVLVGTVPDALSEKFHFPPTVLIGVKPGMKVMQEETFGPLLPIHRVADAEEAVRLANDSDYGLTASVWTRDRSLAEDLARRLETGIVTINNHGFTAALPNAPWTGVKLTGHGVTGSHIALLDYVRPRLILMDKNRARREVWWYPYSETLKTMAEGVHRLAGKGFSGKPSALWTLIKNLGRRKKE